MKLSFELWLEKNSIPQNSLNLFKESIICYKISAYRSAFIMSYIAFQNILKDRILNSAYVPTGINNWNTISSRLRDDTTWDSEVSTAVNKNNPNRIFMINDGIVKQYEAWRSIRNDCAHGKSNSISYSHIETFWIFIQSYYTKFVINGSSSGIMQMVEEFFDISITPPSSDPSYIIENIKLGINVDEAPDFIENFLKYCDDELWGFRPFDGRNNATTIWKLLITECGEPFHDVVIEYIKNKSDKSYLFNFVEAYPNTATEFLHDTSFCRKLWTIHIFSTAKNDEGAWILLCKIISDKMVPSTEMDTFNKNLYKWLGTFYPRKFKDLLLETDYFRRLHLHLFENLSNYSAPNGIYFANSNIYRIREYMEDFGLDNDIVRCINSIYSFASFGDFYSGIKTIMKKEPSYLADYQKIVSEHALHDYTDEFLE
ncbi:MAG: hypothetical protein ACYDEX_07945 [Mobilitalea sp.]